MRRPFPHLALIAFAVSLISGCASFGGLSESLGDSIASQQDPELVRDGAPSYLILADALAQRSPDDAGARFAAARLYGMYAGSFVDDPARRRLLTQNALEHARAGLCLTLETVCNALDGRFPAYREALKTVEGEDDARRLYRFASTWAGWLQARSGDYTALADLPRVEAAFGRVLEVYPTIDHGFAHVYYAVLLAQRPAALGGKPQEAQRHFQRAIDISDGRNLMAKTLYAEHYARLVFNRQLHDRLLDEVLSADPEAGDLTLANALAQRRARELQAGADEFF